MRHLNSTSAVSAKHRGSGTTTESRRWGRLQKVPSDIYTPGPAYFGAASGPGAHRMCSTRRAVSEPHPARERIEYAQQGGQSRSRIRPGSGLEPAQPVDRQRVVAFLCDWLSNSLLLTQTHDAVRQPVKAAVAAGRFGGSSVRGRVFVFGTSCLSDARLIELTHESSARVTIITERGSFCHARVSFDMVDAVM